MDTWDSEEYAGGKPAAAKDEWEGEDEEEDVRDSWDQEPEEDSSLKDDTQGGTAPKAASTKKNTKKLAEKIEEKEKQRRQELLLKAQEAAESEKELTPEEIQAEKIRRQRLQEESDLNLAKEVFGIGNVLNSKEEYDKFKEDILKQLSDSVKNVNYLTFTEELVQSLCTHLSSLDIKKIHNTVGNLMMEKSKLEKGDKAKKSKGKNRAKLKLEGDTDYINEFSAYTDDYDFI